MKGMGKKSRLKGSNFIYSLECEENSKNIGQVKGNVA